MMAEPIYNDRSSAGIGLAGSSGAAWCMYHLDEQIGFISYVDGGNSLYGWSVSGPLFYHALSQAKLE
jgi:hypothetical protein